MKNTCTDESLLDRLDQKMEGPAILHGRNPEELPSRPLGALSEEEEVFAALTGPDRGLTTVNVKQRHLSISDPDVDYIDILDQSDQTARTEGEQRIFLINFFFNTHDDLKFRH